MKLVQFSVCLVSVVGIDGLVLKHQGISDHSALYMPIHFQLFNG